MPSKCVSGLHLCAYFGMHLMIIRMLERQSIVDAEESMGETPLEWAAALGHEAMVKLLLEKGADADWNGGRTHFRRPPRTGTRPW